MPKKVKEVALPTETNESFYPYSDKQDVLTQVMQHYQWWTDDNETRRIREGGWNDVTDAYWGKLPDDWPFNSRTTDPRIRTSLIEKNARLTKNNLRGKVIPRENTDVIKARINNAIIEYQWDTANCGGSMQQKISDCDLTTRLYGSRFGLVYWRTLRDKDGNLLFDGNELRPIDKENCGMDPNCTHIRDAKWFQYGEWIGVEQLEENSDLYPGLAELKQRIELSRKSPVAQVRRDSKYQDKIKQNKQLEDRMGTDPAFPVIYKVTEFRLDKWVIFCPDYNVILAISDNPYDHRKIPVSQLRYYPISGDNLGESEVESVLPLWRAIQAILCSYMDDNIDKMRPPLKVVEGAARVETIVYGPDAMWLVDNPNAITEMKSQGSAIEYFQSTYPILVAAFNTAMGDLSQGVSNLDATQADKSATEVRQIAKQQNTRDQKNQQELAEFIKDIVSMWMSNNKQFLFRNPEKKEHILKIIGDENFAYFKRSGLDDTYIPKEAMNTIQGIIKDSSDAGKTISSSTLDSMIESAKIPRFPIIENPDEEDNSKLKYRTKMQVNENGDSADLTIVPEDLDGMYDYIPDMKSMESSAGDQMLYARNVAFQTLVNPNVITLLAQQGYKPMVKDILVNNFEDMGINDANKFFEQVTQGSTGDIASQQIQGQLGNDIAQAVGGVQSTGENIQGQGLGGSVTTNTQSSIDQQMAQSGRLQG